MAEHNGKFNFVVSIILFIFSVIVFPSLFFLGKEVIANERNNVVEHKDIREKVYTELSTMNKSLSYMRACFDNMQKKMN